MEWWIASVVVPLGVAAAGIVGYVFRSRIEDLRDAERRLSDDRRKIYNDLLAPYINLFAELGGHPEKVAKEFRPAQMRKLGFNFMLVASDDVARAYNAFMQQSYKSTGSNPWELFFRWASLCLEIRKSLGNRNSSLTEVDMVRFILTDIEKFEAYVASRRDVN